jgi:hypothetical protein
MGTEAGGKEVEATGTMTKLNQLSAGPGPAQGNGPLLLGAGMDMAGSQSRGRRGRRRGQEARARGAGGEAAGQGRAAPTPTIRSAPSPDIRSTRRRATWSTRQLDLELPGAFPLVWKRWYTSQKRLEKGQLGQRWLDATRYEQWIEPVVDEPGLWAYRNHQGRDLYIPTLAVGQEHFFRADRLVFTRERDGFRVDELDARRTLRFSRLGASERFWLTSIDDRYGHTLRLAYQGERLAMLTDTAERAGACARHARGLRGAPRGVGGAARARAPGWGPRRARAAQARAVGRLRLPPERRARGGDQRALRDRALRLRRPPPAHQAPRCRADRPSTTATTRVDAAPRRGATGASTRSISPTIDARRRRPVTATNEPRVLYAWRGRLVLEERHVDGRVISKVELDDDGYVLSRENGAGEKWKQTWDERAAAPERDRPRGQHLEVDLPRRRVRLAREPRGPRHQASSRRAARARGRRAPDGGVVPRRA